MSSSENRPFAFASALSTRPQAAAALDEVCQEALARLGGPPDLAVMFVSHAHADAGDCDELPARACRLLGCENLLGATAESIVCDRRELEGEAAISLWLARLPGAGFWPMHLQFERTSEGGTITGWADDLPQNWPRDAALLLLGDPFTFPAEALLERLNDDRPGIPVLGGMASGGSRPGESRVFLGPVAHRQGAAALLLAGPLRIRSVVSQGCHPIGSPLVVTQAQENRVLQLGGKPALVQLQQVFQSLPPDQQALLQRGLHLGRVVNEYQDRFQPGDFLIRNVLGIDPKSGAIAVGDFFRPGQTVQFHLRSPQTASDDLRSLLATARSAAATPAGGLLFTCNGRGTRLFNEPHHDASLVQEILGELPLAGMSAAGEIGPIGGRNFLHGFTASLALFEPA